MALTPAALAQEINTDPQTYGYAAHVATGNDQAIADLLNKPRDGTDGEAAISVKRPNVPRADIIEALDRADFVATPNTVLVAYFESVTQIDTVRLIDEAGNDTRVLSNIKGLLNANSGSRTRLNAVGVEVGSRAQQLFGYAGRVTSSDVAAALRPQG